MFHIKPCEVQLVTSNNTFLPAATLKLDCIKIQITIRAKRKQGALKGGQHSLHSELTMNFHKTLPYFTTDPPDPKSEHSIQLDIVQEHERGAYLENALSVFNTGTDDPWTAA